MKLNTRTDTKDREANETFPAMMFPDRTDCAVSREELRQFLIENDRGVVFEKKVSPLSWADRLATWISTVLWRKTAIGYQDKHGFHYGTPPMKKESHAIGD